jgi:hypothetical protein
MRTQKGTRADTISRHIDAFRDLSSNPARYSQAEWTYKHHIGNRSATSALKMGLIELRNGLLHYVGTAPITTALIKKVLASNAKKREEEREGVHTYEKTLKWDDFSVNGRGAEFYKEINSLDATFPMKAPRPEPTPAMIAPEKVGIIRRFLRWLY